MTELLKGECLCGAVKFQGIPDHGITICHCGQCRTWGAGPYMEVDMSTGVSIEGDTLRWYRSSENGERGFCTTCGSSLFWRDVRAGDAMSVSANALQGDHGLKIKSHIWVDDKPDWYEFADDTSRLTASEFTGGR
ncbi:MAG: GFA family protein [Pseudomonadota bacterium]